MSLQDFESELFDPKIPFAQKAKFAFDQQKRVNVTYSDYVDRLDDLDFPFYPYIPIEVFKEKGVFDCVLEPDIIFRSSGTGGIRSSHPIKDLGIYRRSFLAGFQDVFGTGPFSIVSHLPGYSNSSGESSLLYMVEHLIQKFGDSTSGSVLGHEEVLLEKVESSEKNGNRLILFGAAFGLASMCERQKVKLPDSAIVIETGGMKTYKKETTRHELHTFLAKSFSLDRSQIFSEYGMCELLSQCYTRGGEEFYSPNWLDVKIVDPERPWIEMPKGRQGSIAVFDCANLHSLSAVLTGDSGISHGDGFEVNGRMSNSELRGCNFLIESLINA